MTWVPIAAWGAASLIAIVVLGFCAYEIVWKTHRLQRELGRLQALSEQLAGLQAQLAATQQRLAATGLR